jgi:dolichol-phosphate mannosyltransferase
MTLTLSIIIPTFNERANIPSLVHRIDASLLGRGYELIFVDDNSPDGTAQTIEELKGRYPVKSLIRKNERGLASAVVLGIHHANGDVLAVMDADLQHPPEILPSLLHRIQHGYDLVIATRYAPGGGSVGWPLRRKLFSTLITLITRAMIKSARDISDPMSGFFLLRRRVMDGVALRPSGYKILLEILVRAQPRSVCSVPYLFHARELERSKAGLRECLEYVGQLWRLTYGRRRKACGKHLAAR